MAKSLAKIIFFGNERLATGVTTTAPTFDALAGAGYRVTAAVINQARGNGRQRLVEIEAAAKIHNIPVLAPARLAEVADQLASYQPTIGVLVAYGQIVPSSIIDLFPRGIINIHPSLLPKLRGPTPIEQTILDGADQAGVSLMKLAPKMDAGPVYAQQKLDLTGSETKQALADRLLGLGGKLLLENLSAIIDGTARAVPQEDSQASYTKLINKRDGQIDWHKTAEQIEREVRAYLGWPGSYTDLARQRLIITKALAVAELQLKIGEISVTPDKKLAVGTGGGTLVIEELQPAGGTAMVTAAYLAGQKTPLPDKFS